MRNDYGIRPRATMMKGGKAKSKKSFPDLNKDGKTTYADVITARTKNMSMKKKGKMMKGKR
jgi:hypothetical protein